MLFVFTVLWSLPTYGGGSATVVAPNPVEALRLAQNADAGWMLADSHVNVYSISRGMLAHCQHWNGEGLGDDRYQCDDCGLVYISVWDGPTIGNEPCATNAGFRAYCDTIAGR